MMYIFLFLFLFVSSVVLVVVIFSSKAKLCKLLELSLEKLPYFSYPRGRNCVTQTQAQMVRISITCKKIKNKKNRMNTEERWTDNTMKKIR